MNMVKLYFILVMIGLLINPFITQDEEKTNKVKCVAPTTKMEKVKWKRIRTMNN